MGEGPERGEEMHVQTGGGKSERRTAKDYLKAARPLCWNRKSHLPRPHSSKTPSPPSVCQAGGLRGIETDSGVSLNGGVDLCGVADEAGTVCVGGP
eukprot:7185380-Pyramimonas_sp.AAC.1